MVNYYARNNQITTLKKKHRKILNILISLIIHFDFMLCIYTKTEIES